MTQEERISKEIRRLELSLKCRYKKYLNVEECSIYTGLSKSLIYQKTARKEIPFRKIGKRIILVRSEVDKWLLSQPKVKCNAELEKEVSTSVLKKKIGGGK